MSEFRQHRGFSTIEYTMMIVILIAGLVAFWPYIQRAMQGQYRKSGETFAFGRQYSSTASIECAFYDKTNIWYSVECFNNQVLVDNCKNKANYFSCAQGAMAACASQCN